MFLTIIIELISFYFKSQLNKYKKSPKKADYYVNPVFFQHFFLRNFSFRYNSSLANIKKLLFLVLYVDY